jgi:hypothetical protein
MLSPEFVVENKFRKPDRLSTLLGDWLVEQKLRVLPRSPLGQAISYALANWQANCGVTRNSVSTSWTTSSGRPLTGSTAVTTFPSAPPAKDRGLAQFYFQSRVDLAKAQPRHGDFLDGATEGRINLAVHGPEV